MPFPENKEEVKYKCITEFLEELELYSTWVLTDNIFGTVTRTRCYLHHKNARDRKKRFSMKVVKHGYLFIRVR
jgi:hypothetical protein